MTGIFHIVLARKPIEGTIAENCLQWGCGALWIDGTRIGTGEEPILCHRGVQKNKNVYGDYAEAYDYSGRKYRNSGRWPANLIVGGEEVVGLFPQTTSGSGDKGNKTIGAQGYGSNASTFSHRYESDSGSASRFFFNFAEQESDE